jgi:mono/diheme cytochrome c family protein
VIAVGLAAVALLAGPVAAASENAVDQQVTFAEHVLPILQANCQSCHRTGGDNFTGMVAPMSLVTYDEARPWARSIAKQVQARTMPPWKADPAYHGVFSNERTMTEEEIDTVVRWAKSGAPQGDMARAPEPLVFEDSDGWRIGKPDLVLTADKYFVPDDADTHYVNHEVVLTEDMLPESRFLQAIEWRGDSDQVHHIVGYGYPPGADGDRTKAYGLGSIAPGEEPMHFPEGYAKLLVKGSKIVFSMHYHKEKGPGTGKWDASQVAFKFYPKDAKLDHFVEHNAIGFHSFDIPPNHPNWRVGAARVFEQDTELIALHPHMHVRGKDARYVAYYPDGTSEEILSVPAWDFDWQTDYSFVEPKKLPAGTRLEYIAHYDNSTANPANPNSNVSIDWGPETWDEMMLGYVTYTLARDQQLSVEQVMRDHFGVGPVDQEAEKAPASGSATGSP